MCGVARRIIAGIAPAGPGVSRQKTSAATRRLVAPVAAPDSIWLMGSRRVVECVGLHQNCVQIPGGIPNAVL